MGDREKGEGSAYPGNVLSLGKNSELCGHSAAFPVALPEFFIQAYTDANDVVFDPFLGSGTTLIAAWKNDRAGLGVELSPAYCEVTLRRLERLTGEVASRITV
jgi:DNA modification methylase